MSADPDALANGANRALVGSEVLQFAAAAPLGSKRWRLTGLLRGRAGSEREALAGHATGAAFVLLDGNSVSIDPAKLGAATTIAAIGLADSVPVTSVIMGIGATRRPLTPVHPRIEMGATAVTLRWTRRSRGAWGWSDGVDVPLNEQAEAYLVGVGPAETPSAAWQVSEPWLTLSASTFAQLSADHPGAPLWVRQIGTAAPSDPLLLTLLP